MVRFISVVFGCFLAASQTPSQSLEWKRSLNTTEHGYQVVDGQHPVRSGKTSERFEVRPGDCGVTATWNDCENGKERSELRQASGLSKVGQTYWYSWSIFVPNSTDDISPSGNILGQFHMEDTYMPVLLFYYHKGYEVRFAQLRSEQFAPTLRLVDRYDFQDKWHDIVMNIKWSTADDGFIKIWVNDEVKADYSGKTNTESKDIYIKYGIYRSQLPRYKKKFRTNAPTQVVYFDNVQMGRTRDEVEIK